MSTATDYFDSASGNLWAGEDVVYLGDVTGTVTCNLAINQDPTYYVRLIGNSTVAFTNPPSDSSPRYYTLIITQDETGGRTLSWPATASFDGGEVPPQTTSANSTDIWSIFTFDGGVSYHISLATKDSK